MPETATVQISMPEMGEPVTEGIVLEWHVAEGDIVSEGDTVVEVSTDKVDAEVPAPTDGVITKLIAQVDDEVPVGAPLAEMEAGDGSGSGEPRPAGPVAAGDPPPPAVAKASSGVVPPTAPPARAIATADGARVKASPLACRLAEGLGVDLASLVGSGSGGRIVKKDVEGAGAAAPAPAVGAPQTAK